MTTRICQYTRTTLYASVLTRVSPAGSNLPQNSSLGAVGSPCQGPSVSSSPASTPRSSRSSISSSPPCAIALNRFARLPRKPSIRRSTRSVRWCSTRFNQHLMALVEEDLPIPCWRALRVVAADGSAVCLAMTKDKVRSIVTGMVFGLYLPGIELFLNLRL